MNDTSAPYLFQRGWFWLGVLAAAGLIAGHHFFLSGRQPQAREDFATQRSFIPQPAVTEFAVRPMHETGDRLDDRELVLGVTLSGTARAYPLAMLNAEPKTKVLNDVVAGQAIAVLWCDRCQTGVVYERVVAGRTLTMRVFGSLWRDSIVFEDLETRTQWSQWEGAAKLGQLKGNTLKRLPCTIVDWQSWRREYPGGDVVMLEHKEAAFAHDRYGDASQYLLAVGDGAFAKAWNLTEIAEQGVINDHWQDTPVAAVFLETSGTARLFGRVVDERPVTLRRKAGVLRDVETDSVWDALSGRAIAGPLQGAQLPLLPSWLTTHAAWRQFHPR